MESTKDAYMRVITSTQSPLTGTAGIFWLVFQNVCSTKGSEVLSSYEAVVGFKDFGFAFMYQFSKPLSTTYYLAKLVIT